MSRDHTVHKIEWSALITVFCILILFSTAIAITLIIPNYLDSSWVSPSSVYQKQMYEIADFNLYISTNTHRGTKSPQFVYHITDGHTLLAFQESDTFKIVAPNELKKYITADGESPLKLTSDLLLLRSPQQHEQFDAKGKSEKLIERMHEEWKKEGNEEEDFDLFGPEFTVYELYKPESKEAFSLRSSKDIFEEWIDNDYTILDEKPRQEFHKDHGFIYQLNPLEYRIKSYGNGNKKYWSYSPEGIVITSLEELKNHELDFHSRHELIYQGELIYAHEGCWYCHTDQTRTLIQDVILTGTDDYPAPPSSANEYIYQEISFPGTRRIGPDISRVGIHRQSRDWHKSHFWSPETHRVGTLMPPFKRFFDTDPNETNENQRGIPNYQFEAVYQYLMTKGTRITPPTQAWWLGKDPVQTKEIIEGKKKLP
jgi:cytochrome c oxidase cbb3-type subunit II